MVSCWQMNACESAGMWTQYGKNTDAICIQSTYSTFRACLDGAIHDALAKCGETTIHTGLVDYGYDPPSDHWKAAMYKRKEYAQEQEMRALVCNYNEVPEVGMYIKVDLDLLVDVIYVAPNSNPWFIFLVKQVINRYGLPNKPVERSALEEKPYF